VRWVDPQRGCTAFLSVARMALAVLTGDRSWDKRDGALLVRLNAGASTAVGSARSGLRLALASATVGKFRILSRPGPAPMPSATLSLRVVR
jgi:hypothetical protein